MQVRTWGACLLACAMGTGAHAQVAVGPEPAATTVATTPTPQPVPATDGTWVAPPPVATPQPDDRQAPAAITTPALEPATSPDTTPVAVLPPSGEASGTKKPAAASATEPNRAPRAGVPRSAAPRRATTPAAGRASATKPAANAAQRVAGRPATAGNVIRGRINLAPGPRQDVAGGEVAQTVIYFLPKSGSARPAPSRYVVRTHSKGFEPNLLVVPVGSAVAFPNRDVVLHNVFSKTAGSAFDLGTYAAGESRTHRFQGVGLVTVNCNVHRGMRANVLVLETPHYTRPQPDGSFNLSGLPQGAGTLVIWHPRAAAQSIAVTGAMTAPVVRTLVASRPRIAAMP